MRSQRIKMFAARVDHALNRAHASGKLQWFNAAFAAERCKNPTLNYRSARIRLRNVIARRLLRRQPLSVASLIAEIFRRETPADRPPVAQKQKSEGRSPPRDKTSQRAR